MLRRETRERIKLQKGIKSTTFFTLVGRCTTEPQELILLISTLMFNKTACCSIYVISGVWVKVVNVDRNWIYFSGTEIFWLQCSGGEIAFYQLGMSLVIDLHYYIDIFYLFQPHLWNQDHILVLALKYPKVFRTWYIVIQLKLDSLCQS